MGFGCVAEQGKYYKGNWKNQGVLGFSPFYAHLEAFFGMLI